MFTLSAEEFLRTAAQRLTVINEASERGNSAVQQFYAGSVVLLTGGAGFLGKQLVEKLLRTCDVKKLYLLLRSRKGVTAEQRLQDILTNPVFELVRAVRPGFVERIQVVAGDVTQTNLGMMKSTWVELTDTVTVVIHCAATINFVEPLAKATEINVKGTLEMLQFAKACKNLRAFVHVSSAYTQAVQSKLYTEVPDQFTPSPVSPRTLMDLIAKSDTITPEGPFTQDYEEDNQRALDEIYSKYIGHEYPNTYSFTKAVSEEVVRTMSQDMPVCIVRPTIVISSYTEPTPGWLDSSQITGPSGFVSSMLFGVTHALLANLDAKTDLVPVDVVSNALLASAWDTDRRWQQGENEIKIYTVGSSHRNHITWGSATAVLFSEVRQHLSPNAMWYAFILQTTNTHLYSVLAWLLHTVPAFVADTGLLLVGKRPTVSKMYKKVNKMSEIFRYFFLHDWNFRDDNLLQLYRRMSPTDQQLFNFDIASVDMRQLVVLWNISIRKYILKEGLGGEVQAKRRQFIFKMATFAIAFMYFYIVYKLFSFVINLFL